MTPKHMKLQTLLAGILSVFGYFWAVEHQSSLGIAAQDMLPVLIGLVWFIGVLFAIWWRRD